MDGRTPFLMASLQGLMTWLSLAARPSQTEASCGAVSYTHLRIKKAAALTNMSAHVLDETIGGAIVEACDEIISGKLHQAFIVDAIQGGAGTSANMNANEVIANRAIEILGGKKGDYSVVHPNDHVNMAQSTNDVIPCAGKLTIMGLLPPLIEEMERLEKAFGDKAVEFDDVVKMGRTQLQDAVPIRLGQSFEAYAKVVGRDISRLKGLRKDLRVLNIGATAVGTAINVNPVYLFHIIKNINLICGTDCYQADDLFDATQNLDCFVHTSAALKTCAVSLSKICNDLRLLSSGPHAGIGEINLPPKQNGSSIMPVSYTHLDVYKRQGRDDHKRGQHGGQRVKQRDLPCGADHVLALSLVHI